MNNEHYDSDDSSLIMIMILDMICIDNRQSVGSVDCDCDYTILKLYDMT